jgi:enoyl-CoA hydratase/carnithine racemase
VTASTSSSVVIDHDASGGISVVTLSRPASLNALDESLIDGLEQALRECAAREATTAVVLRGAGRAFCAGNDLKEDRGDPVARVERMHALILTLWEYPKVTVAALHGVALGGGLELAMACTFRVCDVDTRLGLPEIMMNLVPGFGGTQLLPRIVGRGPALMMLLSGESLTGGQASECGLVDAVVHGDVTSAARDLLGRFPGSDLLARSAVLEAVRRGLGSSLRDGLAVERELVRQVALVNGAAALRAFRAGGRF